MRASMRILTSARAHASRFASFSRACRTAPRFAMPAAAAAGVSGAAAMLWQTIQPSSLVALEPAPVPPSGSGKVLTANFIADAAARGSPALVNISVQGSSGSGFCVDPSGLILTNCHVVGTAVRYGGTVKVTLADGVSVLNGVVEHADQASDVAIVRVRPSRPLACATLGESSSLRPGEFVVALGAPAGLSNSVSAGIVSAVARTRTELGMREPRGNRNGSMEYIQTDAAINNGNSGGPLLNLAGEVIGINTMKAMGMDGIAFALPIDDVKRVVDSLQRFGKVRRPYLGLKFVELDDHVRGEIRGHAGQHHAADAAGVPSRGLYVMHVSPESPARRADVRVGDTIVGLDGAPLSTTRALIDGLAGKVERRVTLDLQRGGRRIHVPVDVEALH